MARLRLNVTQHNQLSQNALWELHDALPAGYELHERDARDQGILYPDSVEEAEAREVVQVAISGLTGQGASHISLA